MSYIYIINSLNNIVNYQKKKKKKIVFFFSNFLYLILKKLEKEYFKKILILKKNIIVYLKYIFNKPVIKNINFISKPSRRVYFNVKKIKKINFYNCLISTNKGVLNKKESIKKKVGGEILFSINV
ncbi:30S ribosomal protein S8 [Candidatus Vidania fulgoroideae]|nr:30S ribosomal protein S8 [Candidatus Vidania fulgoroideae]